MTFPPLRRITTSSSSSWLISPLLYSNDCPGARRDAPCRSRPCKAQRPRGLNWGSGPGLRHGNRGGGVSIVNPERLNNIAEPRDAAVLHDRGLVAETFDKTLRMGSQHKNAGIPDERSKAPVCFFQELRVARSDPLIEK